MNKHSRGYDLESELGPAHIDSGMLIKATQRLSLYCKTPINFEICEFQPSIPLAGDLGPDIYSIISSEYHLSDIKLNVPETLIITAELKSPVLIYTNDFGVIKVFSKFNAMSKFVWMVEKQCENQEGPKFLHKTNKGVTICCNSKQAVRSWVLCKEPYHMLQRYIVSDSIVPEKLRVHWSLGEKTDYFKINRKGTIDIDALSNVNTPIIKYEKPRKSRIRKKQDTNHFAYAARMHKTSFSPSFPNKPTLLDFHKSFVTSPKNPLLSTQDLSSRYLVKSSSTSEIQISRISSVPEIESMILVIAKLTEKKSTKPKDEVLVELTVDFIKNKTGKWHFLKCKAHKFDYFSRIRNININTSKILARSRTASPFQLHKLDVKSEHKCVIENVEKRLDNLKTKTKNLARASLNIEETQNNIKNEYLWIKTASIPGEVPILHSGISKLGGNCIYRNPSPAKDLDKSMTSIKFSEQLNKIAEIYDSTRQQARITREERRKQRKITLVEKKNLESLIAQIFEISSQDNETGFSIRTDEIHSINMFRVIFSYCLNSYSPLLKNLIIQSHKFTTSQLHRIFAIIRKVTKECFSEEDFELFNERLSKIFSQLTENVQH
ncbi:unnamed protein product [Blepharisma stoltei]|uniref:Uncharacterized protein n=1 Tax=Blepharisma stoltei TaxID=1481888 RepID=A0AAU9ID61_9CILI|nr:unnamed protein product [Blepharisma stoltei]